MCDTNTINVTFYLLKVLHLLKKSVSIVELVKKIEGGYFIKSNYSLYFISNNFKKKYLRVGRPYAGSAGNEGKFDHNNLGGSD